MNVLLRADASREHGTGHVMRCMTLAEGLIARGHTVTLMGELREVPWLMKLVTLSGMQHVFAEPDTLDVAHIVGLNFDWVVVDSYRIRAELISLLNETTPCLAVIDGDARNITATLYLDQNLGASAENYTGINERQILAGSSFALVREAVLKHRLNSPSTVIASRAQVVAFMGGTDPHGAIAEVAESITAQDLTIDLTFVSPSIWAERVRATVSAGSNVRVIEPTLDLPDILGAADVIVSAAGTSAWDICTMARPALLISLVENQRNSLHAIAQSGIALTIDAAPGGGGTLADTGRAVAELINDPALRRRLIERCKASFDGLGKLRVVEAMETIQS